MRSHRSPAVPRVGHAGYIGAPDGAEDLGARRRTAALAVVCVSLMVVTIDVTILNVALPTLSSALDADTSELSWFINSYELVFAGSLLTAGALGDRFGRRRMLAIGLTIFGVASVLSAQAGSAGELIAMRAVMGIGGAAILPATLAIVTNVFTNPAERAKAIAVWAGVAALGLGVGPVLGGFLLEHFQWGSVFWVNVPVVIVALIGGRVAVPESRDPSAKRLDPVGATMSIVALGALTYSIIEGPVRGWTSVPIITAMPVGVFAVGGFFVWEQRIAVPMLDLSFFADRRFSVAVAAIATLFFGMFSLLFVSTQTLQSVLGYNTLAAGVRLLPLPIGFLVFAQVAARVEHRAGARTVVAIGLVIAAAGLGVGAMFGANSGYPLLAAALGLTGIGMGLVMAPSTESIMGSVPSHKTGVAAAVNDTTRLTAGAVGIAVIGSIISKTYRTAFDTSTVDLPAESIDLARISINNAHQVATAIGGSDGNQLAAIATNGFIDGSRIGLGTAAIVAAVGAAIVWHRFPTGWRDDSTVAEPFCHDAIDLAEPASLTMRPIGWVESTITLLHDAPHQGREGAPGAWIHLSPQFDAAGRDLTEGDELIVLTWLDRADRSTQVVHPRSDTRNPATGVFSTRSPDRPNPIGLHRVHLGARNGSRLYVNPLEAIDNTLVLDIKPAIDRDEQ